MLELKECEVQLKREDWKINKKYFVRQIRLMGAISSGLSSTCGANDSLQQSFVECMSDDSISEPEDNSEKDRKDTETEQVQPVENIKMENNKKERKISNKSKVTNKQTLQKRCENSDGGGEIPIMQSLNESEPVKDAAITRIVRRSTRITPTKNACGSCTEEQKWSSAKSISAVSSNIGDATRKLFTPDKVKAKDNDKKTIQTSHDKLESVDVPQTKKKRRSKDSKSSQESPIALNMPEVLDNPKRKRKYVKKKVVQENEKKAVKEKEKKGVEEKGKKRESSNEKLDIETPVLKKSSRRCSSAETSSNSNSITNGNEISLSEKVQNREKIVPEIDKNECPSKKDKKSKMNNSKKSLSLQTLQKASPSHVSNIQQPMSNKEVKGKSKDKTAKKKCFFVKNSDDIVRCIKYFEFTDEQKTTILNQWQLSAKNQQINEITGPKSTEQQMNYTGCENGSSYGKDVLYIVRIDLDSLNANGTGTLEQKLDYQKNGTLNPNQYQLKVIHNKISIVPADSSQFAEEPDSKQNANSSLEDFLTSNFPTSIENEWNADASFLESRICKVNSLFADDFDPTVDCQPEITNAINAEMPTDDIQPLFDSLVTTNTAGDNIWPPMDFQRMLSEDPIISENILDSCPLTECEYIPHSETSNECSWDANNPKHPREPNKDLEIFTNIDGQNNNLQNICEPANIQKQTCEKREDMQGTTIERAENQKSPMTGSYIISETKLQKPDFIDCLHSSTPVHGKSASKKENSIGNVVKCYDPNTIQGCNLGGGNLSCAFNNISNIEKLKPNDKLQNISSFDKSTSRDKSQDRTIVDVSKQREKPRKRTSFEKNTSKDVSQNILNFDNNSSKDKSQNISSLEKTSTNDKSQNKSKFDKSSVKEKPQSISKLEKNSPIEQSQNNSKSEKKSGNNKSQNIFKFEKSTPKENPQNRFDMEHIEKNRSKEKCKLKDKSQFSPNIEKIVPKDSSQKINLKEKEYIKSNRDISSARRHETSSYVSRIRAQKRYEMRYSKRNISVDVEDCLKNEKINQTHENNRRSEEKLDRTETSNIKTISKEISKPSIEMEEKYTEEPEKDAQICKKRLTDIIQKVSDETSKEMTQSSLLKNNIKDLPNNYKPSFKNYIIPKLKRTEDNMSNTVSELILQKNDIKANQTTSEIIKPKKANFKIKDSPDFSLLKPEDYNLDIEKIIPEDDDSAEETQFFATNKIQNCLLKQPKLSNLRNIEEELALLISDDYDDGFKFETSDDELNNKEIILEKISGTKSETNPFNSSLNKSVQGPSPPLKSCDIVKFGNSETHSLFDQYFHGKTPKNEIERTDKFSNLCDKGTRHLDVTHDYNSESEDDVLSMSVSSIDCSDFEENGNNMSGTETNSQQSEMSLANFMNKELKARNRIVFDLNQSKDTNGDINKKEQVCNEIQMEVDTNGNGNGKFHTSTERTGQHDSVKYEAAKDTDYRHFNRQFSVQAPQNHHNKINSSTKFEKPEKTGFSQDIVPQNSIPNPISNDNTNPAGIIPPSALDSFNLQLMMQTMPPPVTKNMHQRRSGPILPECDPEFLENMRLVEEKPPPDLFASVPRPHYKMRNFNNGYPQAQRRYNNHNNNNNWRGYNRHHGHRPNNRPYLNRPRFEYQGNQGSRTWHKHNQY